MRKHESTPRKFSTPAILFQILLNIFKVLGSTPAEWFIFNDYGWFCVKNALNENPGKFHFWVKDFSYTQTS